MAMCMCACVRVCGRYAYSLVEFEETPSGKLTPLEFETIDLEEEADPPAFAQGRKRGRTGTVLFTHTHTCT
jgi:hypothetical protein